MRRSPLIALVVLVGAVTMTPSALASAGSSTVSNQGPSTLGIRLVAPPSSPANTPLTNAYIVDQLMPGDSLSRTVEIDNNTNASSLISVYVAAANVVGGTFTFAPGRSANGLSSWSSLSSDTLQLAPHSETFDTVTIHVPRNASQGNRNAVLWAAMSASPTAGQGITLISRVGVRMYLAIGPGGALQSRFSLGPLSTQRSASGKSLVIAEIHNSGKSTLNLNGDLVLAKGPDALNAGPFAATLGAILPAGASEQVTVVLDSNIPRGPWRADLKVRSGRDVESSIATITFPQQNALGTFGKTNNLQRSLLAVLSTLILVALFAFAFFLRRALIRPLRRVRRPMPISSKAK
jgi:hypothetical protein